MMNTRICLLLLAALSVLASCRKEDPTYQVNEVGLLPSTAGKTKLKTNEQYVAILHANLFQKALSANQLFDIAQCMESIGDQELAREVLISNFMNKTGVIIPTDSIMRSNLDYFVTESYKRFFIRLPTEAEKAWMKNFISTDPNITPELVYFSFALSDEYMYY